MLLKLHFSYRNIDQNVESLKTNEILRTLDSIQCSTFRLLRMQYFSFKTLNKTLRSIQGFYHFQQNLPQNSA